MQCKNSEARATCNKPEASNSSLESLDKVVVVGHVDHGKSTLLASLLLEADVIPVDKVEKVHRMCDEKNIAFEPAFVLDAFQEEQEQGVSIDTTQIIMPYEDTRLLFIDVPGHVEFLRNMTTGASEAEHGLLVVDCREGIGAQTVTHLRILEILGIRKVVVGINKLDLLGYAESAFEAAAKAVRDLIESEGLECGAVVPISALASENITRSSEQFPWYKGRPLINELTSWIMANEGTLEEGPLRVLLQDVYRFDNTRYFAGKVVSGRIKPGDKLFFSPSGKTSTVSLIADYPEKSIECAVRGQSVALQLAEQVFVERGEIITSLDNIPEVDTEFYGRLVWLSSQQFDPSKNYILKLGTSELECSVLLPDDEEMSESAVSNGDVVSVLVKTSHPLAFDRLSHSHAVDQFVICDSKGTLAAGRVESRSVRKRRKVATSANVTREKGYVDRTQHEGMNGHRGAVLWLTGLPASGKSTLAKALEKALFEKGHRVLALDADNLRSGLCGDLGFTPTDRSENIRRIAQSARLFLNTGFITIVACVSPYAADRSAAREIIGDDDFHEVFVFCPLETCQDRDPKGLYRRAIAGELKGMTGIEAPYQPPAHPAVRLDSQRMSIEDELVEIISYLERMNISKQRDM